MAFPAEEQGVESLWVEPVLSSGSELCLFRVWNIPLFVYGVSLHDVVTGTKDENRVLKFEKVVSRGGHSTFRLIVAKKYEDEEFERFWAPLGELGCTYAGVSTTFLAVDVPREVPIRPVIDRLEEGERLGIWKFEEGHVEHIMK